MINTIPDKVKIGGITYTIVQKQPDNDLQVSDSTVDGEIDYQRQKINLNETFEKEYKEAVLMHEIVHGILYCMAESELRTNEKFVEGFAQVLYQVLKDNDLNFKE